MKNIVEMPCDKKINTDLRGRHWRRRIW